MTPDPMRVGPRLPVAELRRLVMGRTVGGALVVDEGGRLVGIVTRTDLLAIAGTEEEGEMTAGDIMSSWVFSLPLDAPTELAAALMAYEDIQQIALVAPDGHVAGLITALDIVRALVAGHR